MTHATVKDHIVSYIQWTYRYGKDIDVSLRDQKMKIWDLRSQQEVYHQTQVMTEK